MTSLEQDKKNHLAIVEKQIADAKREGNQRLLRNLQRERRQIREALGYKKER